jgi:hypothetical protein
MSRCTKYRIYVSFNEQKFFWIVYYSINRKLIMNPTKDDFGGANPWYYNKTNICSICREELKRGEILELTEKSILHPKNTRQFSINWVSTWYCEKHSSRYRIYNRSKYICDRCGEEKDHRLMECDKEGNWTEKLDGPNCWQKYDPNSPNNVQNLVEIK